MRRTILNSLLIASFACWSASASATPLLSLTSASISTNGTAAIDLNISGLGGGTALGGFDVSVGFDPSIVSFQAANYGDSTLGDQLNLEGFGTVDATTPGAGSTDLFELSFDSPSALTSLQATTFTLATLNFTGLATGTSQLSLSVNVLADQDGNSFATALQNGSISVGSSGPSVPEPGSFSLVLAGFAAVMLGGRWKRRRPWALGGHS